MYKERTLQRIKNQPAFLVIAPLGSFLGGTRMARIPDQQLERLKRECH
jgi:hypothetical protein